jgi:GT2 family glycosyltransferase
VARVFAWLGKIPAQISRFPVFHEVGRGMCFGYAWHSPLSCQVRPRTLPRMASPNAERPRVSIIMPVWNRASLIEHSLHSALAQSFRDFELIVADDGSTDDSAARALALGDPRIVVLRLPHSGRPACARNAALRRARGQYIAFLDSDDTWRADKLAEQVRLLDARPDAALVFGLASYFDGRRERGVCGPKSAHVPESMFELLLLQGNFMQTSTVMLRRDACTELAGFDEAPALRAVEDLDLWLRVTQQFPALFVPRVVCRYRRHAGNLSSDQREMVGKVRAVIAAACLRYDVAPPLRDRVLARWHVEELKAELAQGGSPTAARRAVTKALELDPSLRAARVAEGLLRLGLFRPMQRAYERRQRWTDLRDGWHRLRWSWSSALR